METFTAKNDVSLKVETLKRTLKPLYYMSINFMSSTFLLFYPRPSSFLHAESFLPKKSIDAGNYHPLQIYSKPF